MPKGTLVTYPHIADPGKTMEGSGRPYRDHLAEMQEKGICPFGNNFHKGWEGYEAQNHRLVSSQAPIRGLPGSHHRLVIPLEHRTGPREIGMGSFQALGHMFRHLALSNWRIIGVSQRTGPEGGVTVAHNHTNVYLQYLVQEEWPLLDFVFGSFRNNREDESLDRFNAAIGPLSDADCWVCRHLEGKFPAHHELDHVILRNPYDRIDMRGNPVKSVLVVPLRHVPLDEFSPLDWGLRGMHFKDFVRESKLGGCAWVEWRGTYHQRVRHACMEVFLPKQDPDSEPGNAVPVNFRFGIYQ